MKDSGLIAPGSRDFIADLLNLAIPSPQSPEPKPHNAAHNIEYRGLNSCPDARYLDIL